MLFKVKETEELKREKELRRERQEMARREEEARLEMIMKEAEKAKNGEKRIHVQKRRDGCSTQTLHFTFCAAEAHVFARKRKRSHQNTRTKWGRMASIFKLSFC